VREASGHRARMICEPTWMLLWFFARCARRPTGAWAAHKAYLYLISVQTRDSVGIAQPDAPRTVFGCIGYHFQPYSTFLFTLLFCGICRYPGRCATIRFMTLPHAHAAKRARNALEGANQTFERRAAQHAGAADVSVTPAHLPAPTCHWKGHSILPAGISYLTDATTFPRGTTAYTAALFHDALYLVRYALPHTVVATAGRLYAAPRAVHSCLSIHHFSTLSLPCWEVNNSLWYRTRRTCPAMPRALFLYSICYFAPAAPGQTDAARATGCRAWAEDITDGEGGVSHLAALYWHAQHFAPL